MRFSAIWISASVQLEVYDQSDVHIKSWEQHDDPFPWLSQSSREKDIVTRYQVVGTTYMCSVVAKTH